MKNAPVAAKTILLHPVHLLAFGLGTGLSPKAPGTVGTLLGIPLFLALSGLSLTQFLLACAVLFAIGCWLCGRSAQLLGVHDHGGIVFDEVVGYALTCLPLLGQPLSALWLAVAFALFRLFDVLKPWPIKWLDAKVHGGFGIMVDDAVAAVMAAGCLWGVMRLV